MNAPASECRLNIPQKHPKQCCKAQAVLLKLGGIDLVEKKEHEATDASDCPRRNYWYEKLLLKHVGNTGTHSMILYQHRVQSSLDMYITTLMDKQLGCILVEAHCGEGARTS